MVILPWSKTFGPPQKVLDPQTLTRPMLDDFDSSQKVEQNARNSLKPLVGIMQQHFRKPHLT